MTEKVAIVTGGSRGIGKAVVFELARNGAKVVFTYLNSEDSARTICEDVSKLGGEVVALKADIRSFDEAKSVAQETLKRFGTIDILVNNAGIVKDKALMMMDPSDWKDVIDTNLTGYFNMTRNCIVTMLKKKSGSIVNISSIAGVVGTARQVNYSSAKAGEIGFTKSLAKEVAPYNVRVNAVAPGYIDTDMTKDLKNKDDILKLIPAGRFGEAGEAAKVVSFLAGDRAGYITGQVIKVDGGLAM